MKKILAITACPVGVAHTYMAAEMLEKAIKEKDFDAKVETQGASGVDNEITQKDINEAVALIIAADVELQKMDRFKGIPTVKVSLQDAIKKSDQIIDDVITKYGDGNSANQEIIEETEEQISGLKKFGKDYYRGLMTGISNIIPLIVAGGLMMGLLNAIFGYDATHDVANENLYVLYQLTSKIMSFMVPLLAAWIAYGMIGKPGFIPGLVGGLVMQGGSFGDIEIATAGFLGAMIIAPIAVATVQGLTKVKVHKNLSSVMSVVVVPLVASFVVACVSLYIIAPPIAFINETLMNFLSSLPTEYLFVIGVLLGVMAAADMGGPINKAAYMFSIAMWAEGDFRYYAAFTVAKCLPGMITATTSMLSTYVLKLKTYTEEENDLAVPAFVLGLCGITEGTIPYALKDPKRVIPACMIGSGLAGGLVLMAEIEIGTGAGGSFLMLPIISDPIMFCVYAFIGLAAGVLSLLFFNRTKKVA